MTEALAERAQVLAWEYGLRACDAVQLAAALTWQDSVSADLVIATFDMELCTPHGRLALQAWPDNLVNSR